MGYKNPTIKGISWMFLLRASTRGITFIRLAILARILSPVQFGVFGIATLTLSFFEILTEIGINVFLIQKKEKAYLYIDSAWIVSIIRGVIISLVIVLLTPFITSFFNSPQSNSILYLIALVPIIRGFINPSIINIQKDLHFKNEFYLRSVLLLLEAIIVVFAAFITKSAESFVYGLIVSAVIEVILSFVLFKPWPKLSVDISKIKHIFNRGLLITTTGIFVYLAENLDNIAVGKILGTSLLGIYQTSYKISTLSISEINEVVNKVTFPVYSKFSDDKKRLFSAFVKVVSTSSFIALILGLSIYIFAEQIVIILLGQNWIETVPVVKILAFYGILRTVFGNFSAMFLSLEKQNYVAAMTFVRLLALFIVLTPLISKYGIVGAGYAMLISIFAEIPIILFFAQKSFRK